MNPASSDWARWPRRFGFRLCCALLAILSFDQMLQLFGNALGLGYLWHLMLQSFVPWVARVVWHWPEAIKFHRSGSGDTAYDWFRYWCYLPFAFLVALTWVGFDRARRHDAVVREVVRVVVRYALASTLLGYGMVKLLATQFPPPALDRLVEPLGQMSPMGLVWTFMGASRPYELISGGLEVLGGALLLFRRTTTLGALVSIAVLTNIVLLNFCYDVPVKLFSTTLLFFAWWLVSADLARLANVFVFNRATAPAAFARNWPNRGVAITALIAKVGIVGWMVYLHTYPIWLSGRHALDGSGKTELFGLYQVTEFSLGPEPARPMSSARRVLKLYGDWRWNYITFSQFDSVLTRRPDGYRDFFHAKVLPATHTVEIEIPAVHSKAEKVQLTYRWSKPNELVLDGQFDGRPLHLKGRRMTDADFSLLSRGFHWVNEYPPNW